MKFNQIFFTATDKIIIHTNTLLYIFGGQVIYLPVIYLNDPSKLRILSNDYFITCNSLEDPVRDARSKVRSEVDFLSEAA